MQIVKWGELDQIERKQILSRQNKVKIDNVSNKVTEIIENVRQNGDKALIDYTYNFDKVKLSTLQVEEYEYREIDNLEVKYKDAIIEASKNIENFHKRTCPTSFEYENDGISLGKIYRPIESVGLYIPGGTAPLVSTLMMLAIPANIANCKLKVIVTPPNRDGKISPAILFAAKHCGIDKIYKVGGAQAISALGFGTESIPKVNKIFGPGNKYVTEAKMQVSRMDGQVAIDMPAGPSEVLVIADNNANPEFIASDLLAQAEHDPEAHVVLVTNANQIVDLVKKAIEEQITQLSRKHIILESLSKSAIIVVDSLIEAFNVSNQYAPEHLILHIDNPKSYLEQINNAGSIFIGKWAPESLGDYASGTNHVLPTYGYAKMYSGLDVTAFMKSISFQEVSPVGLQRIGRTVEDLATLEGLTAHKNAVTIRLQNLNKVNK